MEPSRLIGPAKWKGNSVQTGPLYQTWFLKLNDPAKQRALWLRFSILLSSNGFKRVAEVWAISFSRTADKEIKKVALKQSHDASLFQVLPTQDGFRIDHCELTAQRTRGAIRNRGNTLEWDLQIGDRAPVTANFVPGSLQRLGLVKNQVLTLGEDLRFTGSVKVSGEEIRFQDAPGMLGYHDGLRMGRSWVWGQCNTFVTDHGEPTPFIFEGITAKPRIFGGLPGPQSSTFYFRYKAEDFLINSFQKPFSVRSKHTPTEWKFSASSGELEFRGTATAELKEFAGITYEDTSGSLLYCCNSKVSSMRVLVYRAGHLEATMHSNGSAAFEVVGPLKNPYVPVLL